MIKEVKHEGGLEPETLNTSHLEGITQKPTGLDNMYNIYRTVWMKN